MGAVVVVVVVVEVEVVVVAVAVIVTYIFDDVVSKGINLTTTGYY